ncbi:MAG: hypothetical protein WAV23_03950 [Minisyncoccia bacterium]
MNKKKMLVVLGVAIVVILVVSLFAMKMLKNDGQYSVVYLTTGEVYVGQLSTYRGLEMKNGYILQVTKDAVDQNKNNFQLNPLKDAIWAPQELHFTKDNVVFYSKLSPSSKIAETLASQVK